MTKKASGFKINRLDSSEGILAQGFLFYRSVRSDAAESASGKLPYKSYCIDGMFDKKVASLLLCVFPIISFAALLI